MPQEHVQTENPARIGQQFSCAAAERHDSLSPFGQFHHHAAIHVLRGKWNGCQAERKLQAIAARNQNVTRLRGSADAVIGQAAMQKYRQSDKRQRARYATTHHRHQLLGTGANEVFIHYMRRQHAKEVAKEEEQHTSVKQIVAEPELPGIAITATSRFSTCIGRGRTGSGCQ